MKERTKGFLAGLFVGDMLTQPRPETTQLPRSDYKPPNTAAPRPKYNEFNQVCCPRCECTSFEEDGFTGNRRKNLLMIWGRCKSCGQEYFDPDVSKSLQVVAECRIAQAKDMAQRAKEEAARVEQLKAGDRARQSARAQQEVQAKARRRAKEEARVRAPSGSELMKCPYCSHLVEAGDFVGLKAHCDSEHGRRR